MREKIINFFNKMEVDYPVTKWQVFGVDVWPLIRKELVFKLLTFNRTHNNVSKSKKTLNNLPQLSSLIMKENQVDAFIIFDSLRRIKLGDNWYSRLTGPFNEELRKKGLKVVDLEYSLHNVERFPVFDESYSITNQSELIQTNSGLYKLTHLEQYNNLEEEFVKEFGGNISFPTVEYINQNAFYVYKMSKMFETLFINKQTKVVFVVIYFHLQCFAASLAAKRIGIPSVEIQHGKGGSLFNSHWSNSPDKGYNTMPEYFWCWDETSTKIVNEWVSEKGTHKAINGGNPWVELWKDEKHPLVKKYDIITEQFIENSNVNILLTLQPLNGTPDWNENIPDWVMQTIEHSPVNWKWFIRYHPHMLGNFIDEKIKCEERLADLVKSGKVETIQSTELPIMAILRKITVHITPFSTSVIEAKHSGVPSITIHKKGLNTFINEIADGWVLKAQTMDELLDRIEELVQKKKVGWHSPVKSNNVGLSKGLDLILNEAKTNLNYVSPIESSFIRKRILLSDGQYKQIVNEFDKDYSENEWFLVGRAYEKIGDTENTLKCYSNFIKNLQTIYNQNELQIGDLITIRNYYETMSLLSEIERLDNIILNWLRKNQHHQNTAVKFLFNNGRSDLIIKWLKQLNSTLDVTFFTGRAFLQKKETKLAKEKLNTYLEMYKMDQFSGLTKQRNYKMSAHYYLGELFMEQGDFLLARKHLEKCNELANGLHMKAQEYLQLIRNNKN